MKTGGASGHVKGPKHEIFVTDFFNNLKSFVKLILFPIVSPAYRFEMCKKNLEMNLSCLASLFKISFRLHSLCTFPRLYLKRKFANNSHILTCFLPLYFMYACLNNYLSKIADRF